METATKRETTSDTELMLAYRDGDLSSFNELYRRHRAPLYRFLLNSCSSEAAAADLFQDIWARVTHGKQGYSSAAPFQSWLYRIARNRLIDGYRAGNSNPLHAAKQLDEDSQVTTLQSPLQPDEVAEASARASVLSSALETLPVAQREVVLLRHIAGFTLEEISELISENPETVKSRLRYAFTKLRKHVRLLA